MATLVGILLSRKYGRVAKLYALCVSSKQKNSTFLLNTSHDSTQTVTYYMKHTDMTTLVGMLLFRKHGRVAKLDTLCVTSK